MACVLFWGPVDEKKLGGGEIGNNRTLNILKENGFATYVVPKPYPRDQKIDSLLWYLCKLLYSVFLITIALYKNKHIKIVHISGFYRHLIYIEFLIVFIVKVLRVKAIYEIRGGAAEKSYRERYSFYRFLFRQVLQMADTILCQGNVDVKFIKNLYQHCNIVYYPNTVNIEYTKRSKRSITSPIRLVYHGRITPDKGIEKIIDIAYVLMTTYNLDIKVLIIGHGNKFFLERLKTKLCNYQLEDKVDIKKSVSQEKIFQILLASHFFIFPTSNKMEGHSNALTEAMACGVVPICSNQGFNKDVVGKCGVVLNVRATPKQYAREITKIYNNSSWGVLSGVCIKRIQENYSYTHVSHVLLRTYFKLLGTVSKKS